jgi:hypothetical protein
VLRTRLNLKRIRTARLVCAAGFLMLLLFEVGSHLALDAHGHDTVAHGLMSSRLVETHSDDEHCGLAVECAEDREDDHEFPNLQDESSHHQLLLSSSSFSFIRDSRPFERSLFAVIKPRKDEQRPPYLPPKHS